MERVTYSFVSHEGNREINEDSLFWHIDDKICTFAIADGLGGHGRGDAASQTVMKSLHNFCERGMQLYELSDVFKQCNSELLQSQKTLGAVYEMKTTLTILTLTPEQSVWGHVGDSRLYAFTPNCKAIRTLDHSVPQMLVLSGSIPERKIRKHPDRNRLLKVMGVEWEEEPYDISDVYPASQYTSFLLCSDGFWELIHEKQMCSCLRKSKDVEQWISSMTAIVEKNGRRQDMDNYSALGVWIR